MRSIGKIILLIYNVMKSIWWRFLKKLDLYLILACLLLASFTIIFQPNYLFFLSALLVLVISPIIIYSSVWLWVKFVLVGKAKRKNRLLNNISNKCRQCYWYRGKIDVQNLSLCEIYPAPKQECMDFQYTNRHQDP